MCVPRHCVGVSEAVSEVESERGLGFQEQDLKMESMFQD